MRSNKNHLQQGFALPVVIVTASMMLLLLLALLQAITSMRSVIDYSYYSKIAEESAEAGTVYALACYEAESRSQSWGSTSSTRYLTQSSDCQGNQNVYNASTTSGANASIPIRFSVGDITITPSSVNIPATGSVTRPGNITPVTGTTNRSLTYTTNLTSQKSASGTSRTCGVLSGNVYCWGNGQYGQLGNNAFNSSLTPVRVFKETGILSGKQVTEIFSAQDHNCVISEGAVYCWGRNNYGQLGNGTKTNSSKPVKVGGVLAGKTVTAIGGTSYASCAIAEGKIYCWGYNGFGSIGKNTTTTEYTTPTIVAAAANGVSNGLPANYSATVLTSGSRSTNMCAIANGRAYCWGPNNNGQIGNNTTANSTIYRAPVAVYTGGVLNGKTVTAISQDGYSEVANTPAPPPYTHVCAVADGKAYCWGENNSGQLGNNSTTDSTVPVAVNTSGVLNGKTITDVVSGISHSCALTSLGKVACWGANSSGQLGDNTTTTRRTPVAVYEEAGILLNAVVTTIAGGANRGCATANNKAYCWGLNGDGQIGDGSTQNRLKPTESRFLRPKNDEFIY